MERELLRGPGAARLHLLALLMRLVTLTCSSTEIVCALGCGELLVGCDSHSDHPPEVVQKLPRVGKDLEIDAEKVHALKPDLVIASLTVPGHEKVVAALARRRGWWRAWTARRRSC